MLISRRTWTSFVALVGLASASGTAVGQIPAPLAPPNVLIIVTDDQPLGTFGVMPQTRRYFIDEGIRFPHAFATNPICCPARATLMTGRYSHNNKVRRNSDAPELDTRSTLQRYLQDAGYHTAIYGKYLNGWHDDPPHFDRWGVITGPYKYSDTIWNIDGTQRFVEGYWTDALAERSVAFLDDVNEASDDQPWMLYITPPAPHAPYEPAPRHVGADVPRWTSSPAIPERHKSDKPPYVRLADASKASAVRTRAGQLRTLMSVDELVADVMETLVRLGEENTIAFFVSDNGYLWGHHGLLGAYLSKGNPYARSIKIPMLMRWPGQVAAGLDDRLVGLIDIAPTVLSAAGIEPHPEYPLDGRPLADRSWSRSFILNEFWRKLDAPHLEIPTWSSLRTTEYSYVEYRSGGRISFREYYDLAEDPHELRNLLGDEKRSNDPDVRALHRRLADARSCSARSCP